MKVFFRGFLFFVIKLKFALSRSDVERAIIVGVEMQSPPSFH
jgi:hypothetical protein